MQSDTPIKRLLALPNELDRQIAAYRKQQHIMSQSEAARRLLVLGLNAAAQQSQEVQR